MLKVEGVKNGVKGVKGIIGIIGGGRTGYRIPGTGYRAPGTGYPIFANERGMW